MFRLIFLGKGSCNFFSGVVQSRSTWLTAAAALRKAKPVGWGGGLMGKQIKS